MFCYVPDFSCFFHVSFQEANSLNLDRNVECEDEHGSTGDADFHVDPDEDGHSRRSRSHSSRSEVKSFTF